MTRFNIPRRRRYPMRPRVIDMRQHTRIIKIPAFTMFNPWSDTDESTVALAEHVFGIPKPNPQMNPEGRG